MLSKALETGSLLNGFLGNALFALCCWGARAIARSLDRYNPVYRQFLTVFVACSWVVLNIYFYRHLQGDAFLTFSIVSFAVVALFAWRELNQFWRLGLIGADKRVSTGVDYKRSLRLCSNSLDFLGIGASKLTQEAKEFDSAMKRCNRSHQPIRFLLCDPNNLELQEIAKQAGRDREEYRVNVRESLRVIARQRTDRARNIQVRFYKRLPLFRLMLIDGWLCLATHYVFGEGDGSQWPQLHIRRDPKRDKESLYYPFRRYFEELWKESEEWDFASRLGD